jgi:acetate kinase
MFDALLVLNAGSSSLKFSVFLNEDAPRLLVRGQIEGLSDQLRFVARNDSAVISQKEWSLETQLGHSGRHRVPFYLGR